MQMKRSQQQGFTIIELIVVIVILGILAATALPKFVDLGVDAKNAAAKGVAGAAASAGTINYAGCAAANQATGARCAKIDECTDLPALLEGGVPQGYKVAASGTASATNGVVFECQVQGLKSDGTTVDTAVTAAGFRVTAAGN